jgi:hypothetical protein
MVSLGQLRALPLFPEVSQLSGSCLVAASSNLIYHIGIAWEIRMNPRTAIVTILAHKSSEEDSDE